MLIFRVGVNVCWNAGGPRADALWKLCNQRAWGLRSILPLANSTPRSQGKYKTIINETRLRSADRGEWKKNTIRFIRISFLSVRYVQLLISSTSLLVFCSFFRFPFQFKYFFRLDKIRENRIERRKIFFNWSDKNITVSCFNPRVLINSKIIIIICNS